MIYTFICNYNAAKHLPDTFEAIRACKGYKYQMITYIDNASKDNSLELIVNETSRLNSSVRIEFPTNIGKAKAVNTSIKNTGGIDKSDLIFSLDSDIKILNPNFFTETQRIWDMLHSKVSCLVCWQEGNSLYQRKISFQQGPDFNYFVPKESFGYGIAGGGIITNKENWDLVGGYRENVGLFGGDDGWLMYDLAKKTGKPICVVKELNVFHPFNDDKDYRAWKDKCLQQQLTYGKCTEEKGFYD